MFGRIGRLRSPHAHPHRERRAAACTNQPDSSLTGTPVKRPSLLPSRSDAFPTHGVTDDQQSGAGIGFGCGLDEIARTLLPPVPSGAALPITDRDSECGAETWERHGSQRDGRTTATPTLWCGAIAHGTQRRRAYSGGCSAPLMRPRRWRRPHRRRWRSAPQSLRRCPAASRNDGRPARMPSRHPEPRNACPSTGRPGRTRAGT